MEFPVLPSKKFPFFKEKNHPPLPSNKKNMAPTHLYAPLFNRKRTEALREFGGVKELREESLRSALVGVFYVLTVGWVGGWVWSEPGIHRLEEGMSVAFLVVFVRKKNEKFIGCVTYVKCYIHQFSISSCWHLGGFHPDISQLVGNIMGYLRWKETILHQSIRN